MSGHVRLQIVGVGQVSFYAPDATREQIGIHGDEPVQAEKISATRRGIEMHLPAGVAVHVPAAPTPTSRSWSDYFDSIAREAFGGRSPSFALSWSGGLGVAVAQRWSTECRREAANVRRGRGRPPRTQRWDAAREEIYARILQRRAFWGESLRAAIDSAAKLDPKAFRRAFGGPLTKKRIEAAASYFKRHKGDSTE